MGSGIQKTRRAFTVIPKYLYNSICRSYVGMHATILKVSPFCTTCIPQRYLGWRRKIEREVSLGSTREKGEDTSKENVASTKDEERGY